MLPSPKTHMPETWYHNIMNNKDKAHIKTLRQAGYSYRQIADTLNLKLSTVKNHCLRHDIHPASDVSCEKVSRPAYKLCPCCNELFVVDTKHDKRFCSDKCRYKYWKREKDYETEFAAEAEYYKTCQARIIIIT